MLKFVESNGSFVLKNHQSIEIADDNGNRIDCTNKTILLDLRGFDDRLNDVDFRELIIPEYAVIGASIKESTIWLKAKSNRCFSCKIIRSSGNGSYHYPFQRRNYFCGNFIKTDKISAKDCSIKWLSTSMRPCPNGHEAKVRCYFEYNDDNKIHFSICVNSYFIQSDLINFTHKRNDRAEKYVETRIQELRGILKKRISVVGINKNLQTTPTIQNVVQSDSANQKASIFKRHRIGLGLKPNVANS